jgi:hypothetical protein
MNRCLLNVIYWAVASSLLALPACTSSSGRGEGDSTVSSGSSPAGSTAATAGSPSAVASTGTTSSLASSPAPSVTGPANISTADSNSDGSAGTHGEDTQKGTEDTASSGADRELTSHVPASDTMGVSSTSTGESSAAETTDATPTLLGDVQFSVPSQTFKGTLEVELSAPAGGEIRFTTDGSVPTAMSPMYEEALVLNSSTEVRAAVFTNGASGLLSTALYVARDFDVTSDLPLLVVDGYSEGKPTDKETYRRAAFMLFEPKDGVASLANLPTVATRSGHRLRGQSSQSYAKTPYRVELWDNSDEDADYPLAGLPAEADWALISLYVDRSLVRNAFVYELGREIGLQAPRVAFAEVYINHDAAVLTASHYQGVYNITETIKNGKQRLNLKQLKEDDTEEQKLSGGYILSFEYQAVEGVDIPCTGSEPFSRGAPGSFTEIPVTTGFCFSDLELRDPEPASSAQQAWITTYLQQFHDTLHSDPVGAYEDFIDVGSFIDYFLVKELTRDMDAFVRSAYMHKDRDGKLVAGPLWDQDLSLGAGGFFDNLALEGWQIANRRIVHDWFIALTRDPQFLEQLGDRWAELRTGPLSDASLTAALDAVSGPLAAAAARDHERWPISSVRTGSVVQLPEGDTWEAQVNAVRDFVIQRAAWMDTAAGEPFDVPNYPFAP